MATLIEAQAMRVFGDWAPENAKRVGQRAHADKLKPPKRALFVRVSQTTGREYLNRGWIADDSAGPNIFGFVVSRGGKVMRLPPMTYGVHYFWPADIPGSDAPGCDVAQPQVAPRRPWHPHPFGQPGGTPIGVTPAPSTGVTDVTLLPGTTTDEPDATDEPEPEPGTFGRLMKGYPQATSAPTSKPAPERNGVQFPTTLPSMALNAEQQRIAAKWLERTNLTTADLVRAAVAHYLAHELDSI